MKKFFFLAAVVVALSTIFCTIASAAVKDEVIVALRAEPSNVDPHGNSELMAMVAQVQMFETLVKKNEKGEIIPWLAKSWEQIDDRTIRFHLRDDVKFHNGDKLTAEDVAFTIKRATEKPNSAAIFASFDGERTKAVDELTVDVATKAPFAAIFNYLTSTRGGIVCKRAVEEMGDAAWGRKPVATGPFMLDEWVSGTSISYKRNENYWGEKPAYSKLTLKFITESANRSLEIESGNCDIVLDPDTGDLDRLKETDGLKVVTGDSYGISYIIFSMDDELGGNAKIRQALSLALDLDAIAAAVYGEYATPSEGALPSTVYAYKPIKKHEYDPAKAKALLKEAGYENGLEIDFKVPNSSEMQNISVIAQNMWKEIGVTAKIATMSVSEVIAAGRRGENQVMALSATFSTGDPGHALADFHTQSGSHARPNDKHIDELLDKGFSTFGTVERAAVYEEVAKYIYDQCYWIVLATKKVNYVITDKVENFFCDPGNIPSFAGVAVSQ